MVFPLDRKEFLRHTIAAEWVNRHNNIRRAIIRTAMEQLRDFDRYDVFLTVNGQKRQIARDWPKNAAEKLVGAYQNCNFGKAKMTLFKENDDEV